MRKPGMIVLAIAALAVLIQFVPVDRTNPSGGGAIEASDAVRAVFVRSCYDCHSNETKWPWYSSVAPVSWVIARDVKEGRGHLNFSSWQDYSQERRRRLAEEIYEEVSEGKMPLGAYVFIHRKARVAPGDIEALRKWAGVQP